MVISEGMSTDAYLIESKTPLGYFVFEKYQ